MLNCEMLKSEAFEPLHRALGLHISRHPEGPHPFIVGDDEDPFRVECADCGTIAEPLAGDGRFHCAACGGDLCASIPNFTARSSQRIELEAQGCDAFSPAACRAFNLRRAEDRLAEAQARLELLRSLPPLPEVTP